MEATRQGSRTVHDLEQAINEALSASGPLLTALSGGVDSTLLAVASHRYWTSQGSEVLAATASSASLATGELDHCADLAERFGFSWTSVDTEELDDERYLANNSDRCYWCKSALMDQLKPEAENRSLTVALGVNTDDLGDHRPGQQAAGERGAVFPLVTAGFSKHDVRTLARHWDIPVWDRPAMPCLSSRLPYGTAVSVSLLSQIDRAELALRQLGFEDVRVRHYDDTARVEVPADELMEATRQAGSIVDALTTVGYRYVTLDLAGLRSGNLNSALGKATVGTVAQ